MIVMLRKDWFGGAMHIPCCYYACCKCSARSKLVARVAEHVRTRPGRQELAVVTSFGGVHRFVVVAVE